MNTIGFVVALARFCEAIATMLRHAVEVDHAKFDVAYQLVNALPNTNFFDDRKVPFEHSTNQQGFVDQRRSCIWVTPTIAQEEHGWR